MSHAPEASSRDTASLTCFLSSSASTDTEPVRRTLAALGVTVQTMNTLPLGSDIGSALNQAILSADFVCVVFAEPSPNPTVMFEAGIAVGSRRPLLVVTAPQATDTIALDLLKAPVVRYTPGSEDAFRENLAAYLENVQPFTTILTTNYDRLVERTLESSGNTSSVEGAKGLEKRLAEYLIGSADFIATNVTLGDQEIDAIANLPMLGEGFNPVLFEVKHHGDRMPGRIERRALEQLFAKLSVTKARIGLLVYGDQIESRVEFRQGRAALIVSVAELESWDARSLEGTLARVRNQLVHDVQ